MLSKYRVRLVAFIGLAAILTASPVWGAMLSWGADSDLPNGVLGVGGLTGGNSRLFTNPGNEGFDVQVKFSGSFSGGYSGKDPALSGANYIWFQSSTSTAQTFAWVEFYFFKTGTSEPIDVLGFNTKLEDVERGGTTREWLIGPKIVSGGVAANLSFTDSTIFDVPAGTWGSVFDSKLVNGEWLSRADPGFNNVGGTQAGKAVGIDLSDIPLSYFRIGESRDGSSAGSVLMGPIGDIGVVPEPASLAMLVLGGLALLRRRSRRLGKPQPLPATM